MAHKQSDDESEDSQTKANLDEVLVNHFGKTAEELATEAEMGYEARDLRIHWDVRDRFRRPRAFMLATSKALDVVGWTRDVMSSPTTHAVLHLLADLNAFVPQRVTNERELAALPRGSIVVAEQSRLMQQAEVPADVWVKVSDLDESHWIGLVHTQVGDIPGYTVIDEKHHQKLLPATVVWLP